MKLLLFLWGIYAFKSVSLSLFMQRLETREIREGARRNCYKKNIYLAVPWRKVANWHKAWRDSLFFRLIFQIRQLPCWVSVCEYGLAVAGFLFLSGEREKSAKKHTQAKTAANLLRGGCLRDSTMEDMWIILRCICSTSSSAHAYSSVSRPRSPIRNWVYWKTLIGRERK